MLKRILLSLLIVLGVTAGLVGATRAYFSDTETSEDNTFSAAVLDLTIDGEDEPLSFSFTAENMVPGETYRGNCVTLANEGTIDGRLTLQVSDPVSNENGLYEPETDDGDAADTEVDNTGYNANGGYGELWDQMTFKYCLETGAGSHSSNGICDWDDITLYSNNGTPGSDYSTTYSLPLDQDLAEDDDYVLGAGESIGLCVEGTFVEDTSNWWWGGMSGMTNNQAMSDDVVFDVIFGLVQTD